MYTTRSFTLLLLPSFSRRGQLALDHVPGHYSSENICDLKGEHNSTFSAPGGGIKNPRIFFRGGHLFLFYCTGFVHCHSSEDNSPSDQCLKRSGFGGNAYITSMFCFNSTPSWKPEPDSAISLRNMSETCSQASTLTAKLLKGLRFHLLKYRKPLQIKIKV